MKLFSFQEEGVTFLRARRKALLADEMGLGKTIQALVAIPPDFCPIAVVPAFKKLDWELECKKWRPDLEPCILYKRDAWETPKPNKLIITNTEILPDFSCVKSRNGNMLVILDESQCVSKARSQRTKKMRALMSRSGINWLLTGSPVINNPMDLWVMLRTAGMAETTFGSFIHFTKMCGAFKASINKKRKIWKFPGPDKMSPELHTRLQGVMLRRLKSDVWKEMPEKTYHDIPIDHKSYTFFELSKIYHDNPEFGIDLPTGKLPPLDKFAGIRKQIAENRIPAMQEIVEEFEISNTPLVVFSAHRAPIEHLQMRKGWGVVLGNTPNKTRQKHIDNFQSGKLRGIALTIGAGGIGVNLSRASNALFVDLEWAPALNNQVEDRLHRIGQKARNVHIMRFIGNHTLDFHLHKILTRKQKINDLIVDGLVKFMT